MKTLWIIGIVALAIVFLIILIDQILNTFANNTNCFLCFGSSGCDKCFLCIRCKCCDNSSFCINCVIVRCSKFCKNCKQVFSSRFCKNCEDCDQCINCTNTKSMERVRQTSSGIYYQIPENDDLKKK